MSDSIAKLLVLRQCEAVGCRRGAVVTVTLTHPRWKKPERADLCARHRAPFIKTAEQRGITTDTAPIA
jgi:hypothetical protein